MKKLYTIIFLLIFCLTSSFAQREETIFGHRGVQFTGVWAGSTNGIIKFEDAFSLNNGGFVVFEFNNNFLVGWSGYGSGTDLDDGRNVDIDGNDLLIGYTFNSNRSLHPSLYMKGGSGTLNISGEAKDKVTVYQPSVGIEANVFRWMRVGLDAGYRFVTNTNTAGFTDSDFSSPVVELRFKFGWSWGR